MKKTIILLAIAALGNLGVMAQNKDTKKADKQYSRFEFVDAAESYNDLIDSGKGDAYVYRQLADCYYNIFNTVEAERWYAKVLENESDAEAVYRYSQMLKANGKYDASNVQMEKFASLRPSDHRATSFKKNPNYLPKILEKGKKFNVQDAGLNTEGSEFGGTMHDGKLYITSSRNSSRKTYGWNAQPYLDIYSFTKSEDGSYVGEELLNSKINTKFHEGMVSFSPDGNTMYFSRESFFERMYEKDSLSNNRYSVLHLYKASKLGDDWDNVEGFAVNSKNYSVKNPSVSTDGKTLYFASDMPGGFGQFDIYKAAINADGSLGEAENMGQKVNTEGQEMFPYSSSNGTLYFSSNGHLGLGGLDVFFTKEIDGKLAPVRNIGIPVNSNADDFAFSIDEESKEGFVSSNRDGGQGSDDIYAVKAIQPICDVMITAVVTDAKTGNPLSGAMVAMIDKDGNKINSKMSDSDGIVEFIVECEQDTVLEAGKTDYESKKEEVPGTEEEEVNVSIALDPIEVIIAEEILLDPIYFDFDKSNITAKAAFELDKLVQIMTKYPDMTILATSHTDSRGSDSYNMSLSDRRAKTTVQYVISKGIDKSRIVGEGRGETEPKADCKGNCTEDDHQMNRRSQFLITSKPML